MMQGKSLLGIWVKEDIVIKIITNINMSLVKITVILILLKS